MDKKQIGTIILMVFILLPSVFSVSYDWVRPSDYCAGGVCIGSLMVLGNFTVIGDYVNVTVTNYNMTGDAIINGNLTVTDDTNINGNLNVFGFLIMDIMSGFFWNDAGDIYVNNSYTENSFIDGNAIINELIICDNGTATIMTRNTTLAINAGCTL